MQSHQKVKKFTHNRMKAVIERNENEDKENRVFPDMICNKKFSVELPSKHSESYDIEHQKNIFNQQISVTLNTSNNRPNFEKDQIGLDIKTLTTNLARQRRDLLPLKEILRDQLNDIRSIEVRILINRLIDTLNKQRSQHSFFSSMASDKESTALMVESSVRPIIEKQLEILQKNFEMLQEKSLIIRKIKQSSHDEKMKMLQKMRQIEKSQQAEINQNSYYL